MPHAQRNKSRGFTLVEMMVTVVVMVVLLGVAVPSFRQMIANQRVKTASFDLYSALSYARSEAIKRNATVTVRAGESVDGAWSTGWRIEDATSNLLRSWGAISSLTVSNTATGNATVLTFNSDGRLTTAAAPKLQIEPSTAVTGVSSRCVQISLSGRPTAQTGSCP